MALMGHEEWLKHDSFCIYFYQGKVRILKSDIYGNLAHNNNYYLLLLVGLFKVSALATVM